MNTIRKIDKKDVLPYRLRCEKEGLRFSKGKVEYYGYFIDDKLAGFVGVEYFRNKAILKNDYVFPEYRNKGIYRVLNKYRMSKIKERGINVVEANLTKSSLPLHLKNGAKIIRKYRSTIKARYEDLSRY